MSSISKFFQEKYPSIALLLAGAGLTLAIQKVLPAIKKKQVEEIPFEEFKTHKNYGDVKPEDEIKPEELELLLKEYAKKIADQKMLENIIPRAFETEDDLKKLCENLRYTGTKNDLESLTKAISKPIWELLMRGGKKWRPILCMLIMDAYGVDHGKFSEIIAFSEIVHNGTLIIDDIQDGSLKRRDLPCVHLLFGVDIAINAGNMMYFAPFYALIRALENNKEIPRDKLISFSKIYSEEMVNVHFGQGWDIYWHNQQSDVVPTVEQYLQMTSHKTGCLARLSSRLACEAIGVSQEIQAQFSVYSETIGVAFQIQDDILNLVGKEYVSTKGMYGEDIYEGKITLMVIHSLKNGEKDDSQRLKEILKMKTQDQDLIDEAIKLIQKTGSIDYARGVAEDLIKKAWEGIKDFIPNVKAKAYLKAFSQSVINRKK